MTINFRIKKSAKKSDYDSVATIFIRIKSGAGIDVSSDTRQSINPNYWDPKKREVKTLVVPEKIWMPLNKTLRELKTFVEECIKDIKEPITKKWLDSVINQYYNPKMPKKERNDFFDIFNKFLRVHQISDVRRKNYMVLKRSLQRFELYQKEVKGKSFSLVLSKITSDTLFDFKEFFKNEYKLFETYPKLFLSVPESARPHPRGRNTIIDRFNRLRAFFEWCKNNGYCSIQPFDNFEIGMSNYGRPIYITLDERNQIMNFDLSHRPQLALQRDIFIFQSFIGCRVSDLYRFTWNNISNNTIEYIPHKTKDGSPLTVCVPINEHAVKILERYRDEKRERLFPFISVQKYNDAIKEVFKVCGINRIVTILDPLTNEEVQKPIYEIASSHMARRTFIGNLYKQVKDQNLISSLSGHREGSRAFARYRDIDNEMKKELINLLN